MANKNSLLLLFLVICFARANAEDYIVPPGITVLNETQLLTKVIGNSFVAEGQWTEYYVPHTGESFEGQLKGWDSSLGAYGGKWKISGAVMCTELAGSKLKVYNNCFTTVLDGGNVKWYLTNGKASPSNIYSLKLVPGNPRGL